MHKLTKLAALFAVGALVAPATGHAADITVVSWGGAYTASQIKAYHEPYMQQNPGEKINSEDYSGGLAEVRAQSEADNVTWDLVDTVMADALTGCDEGLFLEIDPDEDLAPAPDGMSASADFLPPTLDISPCFIPQIAYSTVFGYREDLVGSTKPSSVADAFDLKKFPGKRALQKTAKYNLEWALMADGVPADQVYDVLSTASGVDRAFAKLDTIKDQVIWWEAGAQTPQLLADGEVIIGTTFNGRLFAAAVEENKPIAIMWEGQALDLDGWAIPASGKNIDAAKRFVYFATDSQRLADQAKYISYGPLRKSSLPLVGRHAVTGVEMGPHMPTTYAEKGFWTDYGFWADNGDELNERFNAWLAS